MMALSLLLGHVRLAVGWQATAGSLAGRAQLVKIRNMFCHYKITKHV